MTAAASLSLAQLQATFHQALHYQASGEQCNITSDHFSADERIQIYRNNFIISLSDVLQATYPMLLALWGEECFAQVARQHVINAPLNRADVSHYGQGFAETIMQFPAVLDAAPYSLEVAQFEWTMDLAQQQHHQTAADASWLPLSDLTQLSAEQYGLVRLKIAPGVLAFESCYALFSLQHAIQTSDFSALTLEQTEQGVIACQTKEGVWCLALANPAYLLLKHLQSGCLLGDIPPPLLAHLSQLTDHDLVAGFTLAA